MFVGLNFWFDEEKMIAGCLEESDFTMTRKAPFEWKATIEFHPMFAPLSKHEREVLLSDQVSTKRTAMAGEAIIHHDSTGDSLFIIGDGVVSVMLEGEEGQDIELYKLSSGEIFGEMALFGQDLRTATLVAAETSNLLEIRGDDFLKIMEKHHEISIFLLTKLSERLHRMDDLLLSQRSLGTDGSMVQLGSRLDIVTQTTDAKLAAAQSMFERTNARAGEAIDAAERTRSELLANADRGRTRTTWLLSTATAVVALISAVGFVNFERSLRQIDASVKLVNEAEGRASDAAKEAQRSAAGAGKSATEAGDANAKAKESSDELDRELERAQSVRKEIDLLRDEFVLAQFLGDFASNGYSQKTQASYLRALGIKTPKLRERFMNFVHAQTISGLRRDALLPFLNTVLEESEREMDLEGQITTYYFAAVVYVLQGEPEEAAQFERLITEKSRGREFFTTLFGSNGFDSGEFVRIITAAEKDETRRLNKEATLRKLYIALGQPG